MVHIWVLQLTACPLNKLLTVIYLFFFYHETRLNILKKSMNARLKINTLFLNNTPIIFSYNFASIVCYAKHSSETSWHLKHSRVTGKTVLLILGASHFTDSREPATPSITLAEMFNNNQQGHNTVHFLNWNIKKCNNTIINNSILTSNIKGKLFQIIKRK